MSLSVSMSLSSSSLAKSMLMSCACDWLFEGSSGVRKLEGTRPRLLPSAPCGEEGGREGGREEERVSRGGRGVRSKCVCVRACVCVCVCVRVCVCIQYTPTKRRPALTV